MAWHPLEWKPAWFSEIDPFACEFLSSRFPDVPNLGDMTTIIDQGKLGEKERNISVLVGGTPCQSFSIAGLRKGLDDDRGNLAYEFVRLAEQIRPRWIVWENVTGALSSNGGRDFGSIIGALVQCGYGVAWRVLDAQYVRVESHPYSVPQRRRRIFVVGYLGDWRSAVAVLFEPEAMSKNVEPHRRKSGAGESVVRRSLERKGRKLHVNEIANTFDLDLWNRRMSNQCLFGTNGGSHFVEQFFDDSDETILRHLTVNESEVLMGFPIDWTKIDEKTSIANRYKALGNSMCVNVMSWIGQRINLFEETLNA